MTSLQCFWGLVLSFSLFLYSSISSTPHVYIVYLGLNRVNNTALTSKHHLQLLSNVFHIKEDAKQAMLYSYKYRFSGFSARINTTQAATLAKMKGVISVFKSKTLQLHTTRSWDFLGLTLDTTYDQLSPFQLAYGDDVVVGVFDTGVWPESESFQEESCIRPIPSTWKGECVKGERFNPLTDCNRKLIGARYYLKGFEHDFGSLNESGNPEFRSARDFLGHGTHTASTAVGSIVRNVSYFGLGKGVARGGAPRARLAVYKICWGKEYESKCSEADIMAAFDDALHDGVNVISASIGAPPPLAPFYGSVTQIGSFHAMQLGVTVVFSAGNDGPNPSSVQNVAPWSICVAASSTDRTFPTKLALDNKITFMGESFITTKIKGKLEDASDYFYDGICDRNKKIAGKSANGRVILCFSTVGSVVSGQAQAAARKVNASALIFVEPMTRQLPEVDIIPTLLIDFNQGTQILNYLYESPRMPVVEIEGANTEEGRGEVAPSVAYFSSRGPSSLESDILKPDITAPGLSIIAAWPQETPPTVFPINRGLVSHVRWNFQSGTSMSCPHVSGVVALLKSAHPLWSPAAIRSALITTAYTKDTTYDSILGGGSMKASDAFDMGGGHINPLKAMEPGLIYDMKTSDYIIFLCNLGYTREQIDILVLVTDQHHHQTDTTCPSQLPNKIKTSNSLINYPSITVSNLQSSMTIKRTVRNVGQNKNAIYFVSVVKPQGVEVVIWPRIMIFSWFKEENTYYVTLKPNKKSKGRYDFGEIVWSDGFHKVTSPLVVRVNNTHAHDDDDDADESK